MSISRSIALPALALSAWLVSSANAQSVALVDHQGTWSVYADTASPKEVCFVAAQPQAVEPIGANRGPIYFYISAWPKDGIKLEPSVKAGYPVKPDKDMTVTIGSDTFKMYGKGDRGFILDPTEELKLIESMKKGSSAVVKGISAKGTGTTDTYSLTGLAQALDKMATTCP
jgi:invasion associated locus B (IalB) protein